MTVLMLGAAGCNEQQVKQFTANAYTSFSPALQAEMARKQMSRGSPIIARIFKEEGVLEIWKQTASGRYDVIASYPICKYSGKLGPKYTEGDRQAPEGFYTVRPGQMNPNSKYTLSFNIGYPNAYDRANGRTGANLMVHGACSSSGCYSMTDPQMRQIFAFAAEAFKGGQREFQIQAFPFRMTAQNMARYRNDPNFPFWQMLKQGYDAFQITRVPPRVDVCEKRYVFNRQLGDGKTLSATGACPTQTTIDPAQAAAYQTYEKQYSAAFDAALATKDVPAAKPSINGAAESKLVADWTKRRDRGERIPIDPPSLGADGKVIQTSRMGRADNEVGREMAAKDAAAAAKEAAAKAEAERKHQDKIAKELAKIQARNAKQAAAHAKVDAAAAGASPQDATNAETAAPVADATPPPEEKPSLFKRLKNRVGSLVGG